MKKAFLLSSVVFCTVGAMAQVATPQVKVINNQLAVHSGDAFTVRLTNAPQLKTSSLLKNSLRAAGLAAAAYQTDKLVESGGAKPTIATVGSNWQAPVGVATTLEAGKLAGLFSKSSKLSIKYALYDNNNNLLAQKLVQVTQKMLRKNGGIAISGTAPTDGLLQVSRFDGINETGDGLDVDVEPKEALPTDDVLERETSLKTLAPPLEIKQPAQPNTFAGSTSLPSFTKLGLPQKGAMPTKLLEKTNSLLPAIGQPIMSQNTVTPKPIAATSKLPALKTGMLLPQSGLPSQQLPAMPFVPLALNSKGKVEEGESETGNKMPNAKPEKKSGKKGGGWETDREQGCFYDCGDGGGGDGGGDGGDGGDGGNDPTDDPCAYDPESCDPCLADPESCDPCLADPAADGCDPCIADPTADGCSDDPCVIDPEGDECYCQQNPDVEGCLDDPCVTDPNADGCNPAPDPNNPSTLQRDANGKIIATPTGQYFLKVIGDIRLAHTTLNMEQVTLYTANGDPIIAYKVIQNEDPNATFVPIGNYEANCFGYALGDGQYWFGVDPSDPTNNSVTQLASVTAILNSDYTVCPTTDPAIPPTDATVVIMSLAGEAYHAAIVNPDGTYTYSNGEGKPLAVNQTYAQLMEAYGQGGAETLTYYKPN